MASMSKVHLVNKHREGSVALIVALTLVALVGFSALIVDVGHLYLARSELQNAADAAALAGAQSLCVNNTLVTPNWDHAESEVNDSPPANASDNNVLTDYHVETGYWNLDQNPPGLQDPSILPRARDVPAVQVTVRRAEGENSGSLNAFFGSILGINKMDVGAMATAVTGSPGTALPGALFPLIIARAFAENRPSDLTNVNIATANLNGADGGYWSTFFETNNGNRYTSDLLDGVEQSPEVRIGSIIQVNPGVRANDYRATNSNWSNHDVVLPVVPVLDGNSTQPVVGLVGFHIVSATDRGNNSFITGYFLPTHYSAATSGIATGPNFGVCTPPRLVK